MFKSWRGGSGKKILLSALAIQLAGNAYGATVGQMAGNTSIWANPGNFSNIFNAATMGAGHTVESSEALTATNIANNTHYIVESSATAMAAEQVSLIADYVRGGGTLLLFATPTTGRTSANQILGALGAGLSGSAMNVTGSTFGFAGSTLNWGTLSSTDRAVQGGPANLNNSSLNFAQTYILSGGSLLALNESPSISDAIRVDRYSLGKVYLFGSHIDSNLANSTNQNNIYFFLNILSGGSLPTGLPMGTVDVGAPEPATFALTAFALAGVALYARRKRA